MSFNLLDVVKSHFSSDLITKAASFLGETEGGVSKAIGGILPTVLSGLTHQTSTSQGASEVAQMAKESHNSGILGNLSSFFGGGDLLSKGTELVKGLFGSKLSGITDVVSNLAGIKSSSTGSLMAMAMPVVLGSIGKHSADNQLGASGIASMLSSSKSSWASMLPSGLSSLLGGLGLSSVASGVGNAASSLGSGLSSVGGSIGNDANNMDDTATGGVKWLLPLLLIAGLGVLAWWLVTQSGCGKSATATGTMSTEDSIANAKRIADSVAAASGKTVVIGAKESLKVKLADGTEIEAYKGGIESQLVAFLNDKAMAIDTVNGNWFDFDNLNFKTGSSELTDSSKVQVNNIAAILKAYPTVKMKIGGYTDASGSAEGNKKLSQSRAEAVMAAIVKVGGNAAQITKAEGYGSTQAKVPATATDEERRKDRRTAVKIVAK